MQAATDEMSSPHPACPWRLGQLIENTNGVVTAALVAAGLPPDSRAATDGGTVVAAAAGDGDGDGDDGSTAAVAEASRFIARKVALLSEAATALKNLPPPPPPPHYITSLGAGDIDGDGNDDDDDADGSRQDTNLCSQY